MKAELVAREIIRVPTGIANAYIVGSRREWVLVDAGTPGNKENILSAVHEHLGSDAPPQAVILTHGHFDHAGSAKALAQHWGVPIFVHRRELPFVNGTSAYPPPDPTVGGFMAQVIRFIPNLKVDLTPNLRELHAGELPWLSGWQVIETPGHTAGHVSFFRREDGVLLAGDAFTTMNQDSMIGTLSRRQQVWRPPTYYTPDWQSAAASVRRLAELSPNVLAAGHGVPMSGTNALEQLRNLARDFPIPEHGRYIHEPALTDQNGITYLPPPVPDPVKRTALIGAAAAGAIAAGIWLATRPAKKQREDVGSRKAA